MLEPVWPEMYPPKVASNNDEYIVDILKYGNLRKDSNERPKRLQESVASGRAARQQLSPRRRRYLPEYP